jgi:translation initiation factor IF-2
MAIGSRGDQEVPLSAGPGVQPPGAVPAGRPALVRGGDGEPRPGPRPGWPAFLPVPAAALGFGPGAAVADRVALLVGHGDAPGGCRVAGGGAGQVPGQGGVDGAEAGDLAGPAGQVEQGGQRDGQVDLPGEPGRQRAPVPGSVPGPDGSGDPPPPGPPGRGRESVPSSKSR